MSISRSRHTWSIAIVLLLSSLAGTASAESKLDERVNSARSVLVELNAIPEQAIPPALLERAHAIAIIPNILKIGLGVGGRHGRGILSVRGEHGWSAPVFVALTGGSIGWQAGAQSSDLVLVFTNERGVRNITKGKLTLGADASVAAGPVGRHGSAATDIKLQAEVYSYSRTRGLFAGISLEGAALRIDNNANTSYYVAPNIAAADILYATPATLPESARGLMRELPTRGHGNLTEAELAIESTPSAAPQEAQTRTYALGEKPATFTDDEQADENDD